MSVPEYLARAEGRVDLGRLGEVRVAVFGIGTVGSTAIQELASCGVRRFRLIDGDEVEMSNVARGSLKHPYVGRNKAEAMADLLRHSYPPEHLDLQYYPCFVDGAMSDDFLDRLIEDADLVIAATDQRAAQRRIAGRAITMDIPALFPALHEAGGAGEVFAALGVQSPCLLCWEAFRVGNQDLRAVSALNVEALPVIGLTVELALGLLDTESNFARRWFATNSPGDQHRTLFMVEPGAPVHSALVDWSENCPMCPVGRNATGRPAAGTTLIDVERFARERPGTAALAAWSAVSVIVALATGSWLATIVSMASIAGLLYAIRGATLDQVVERTRSFGGWAAAFAAVTLVMLVVSFSTGSAWATFATLLLWTTGGALISR